MNNKECINKIAKLAENTDKKHKDLMIECDMLQGNINRMMVTDDHKELLTMFVYAHHRLDNIYWQNKKRIDILHSGESSQ